MKIAVVGAGAAAAGVLSGLRRWAGECEISLFDIARTLGDPPKRLVERGFDDQALRDIYDKLREQHRFAFPPPKSHFGETLAKYQVGGAKSLWRSEHHGGLTTIWGGGMFPFTDRELARWPITAAELHPYYRLIAENVGVCGEDDALDDYFPDSYINRPALRTSPVMHKLVDTVNHARTSAASPGAAFDYDLIAGASRLALETRPGQANQCTYLGECMLGCPRQAVWSAARDIDRFRAEKFITHHIQGRVRRFDGRHLEVETHGASHREGPFDRIFIAAGCIGSTELVMRSLGIERGPRMFDNAVLSFPILYSGHYPGDVDDRYFSLCNASMIGVPRSGDDAVTQVSLYPSFDHLWRFYTPSPLWRLFSGLWRFGRWRFLLGRVFFAGRSNRTFSFALDDGELAVTPDSPPMSRPVLSGFMASMRRVTNHNGFYLPPVPPEGQATSSHYAGTFPYGGDVVPSRTGRVAPGVYLADASTWVNAPAISPTFTIMANACRTAREALAD